MLKFDTVTQRKFESWVKETDPSMYITDVRLSDIEGYVNLQNMISYLQDLEIGGEY
jgi:hypothetical protein